MKRITPLIIALIALLWLVGCGPTVTVTNKTGFAARVIVVSNGERSVLSPTPGESSTAEVQAGPYTVTVIPDTEWLEYAKLTRNVLNEQLAEPDKLSGQQLLEVIRRLKEIADKMQQFERAAGSGASCAGSVGEEDAAAAEVRTGADGKLTVACKQ